MVAWEAFRSAASFFPVIDEENCRLVSEPPTCPHCGELARPNILMFGDMGWLEHRQREQMSALHAWIDQIKNPVVVEIGAGTAIPTVRNFGERLGCPLVRINITEHHVSNPEDIGLAIGGHEALSQIWETMERL